MIGCDIAVINSVDEILPTPLDFMLLKNVILGISACQITMTTGRFQGIFMVLQLILDPLRKAERAPHTKSIWLFLKGYLVIRKSCRMQAFLPSSLTYSRCWGILKNGE